MKDPINTLQKAYFDALDGNLTDLASGAVALTDKPAPDEASIYVFFADSDFVDTSDKQKFQSDCKMTLIAVARFDSDHGGQKEVNNLIDQIVQLIRTRTVLSLAPDFQMITSTVESSNRLPVEKIEGGKAYSREVTFNHIIAEL